MTPQERKVLELALEVIQDYVEEYGPHDKDSGAQYTITAIKEVLAQPEQEPLTEEEIQRIYNSILMNHMTSPEPLKPPTILRSKT